jgi:heme exporter protein C
MTATNNRNGGPGNLFGLLAVALLAGALAAIFLVAPRESTMGDAQRILYVHVAMAWIALLGMLVTAGGGILYLLRRNLAWDYWSQAAAELGWLSNTLTLITGSLWAHSAWGIWWTWDPRLTAAFILWTIYCGYLLVRSGQDDPHRRARLAAVVAVVGLLDVPLVVMATRWFRGVHPVAPQMEPSMRLTLLLSAVGFTAFFALLLARRRAQLHLEQRLAELERQAGAEDWVYDN